MKKRIVFVILSTLIILSLSVNAFAKPDRPVNNDHPICITETP